MPKNEDEVKKVAPTLSEQELSAITANTGAILAKQPKVKIRLRKEEDKKAPNFETVQINGYTYQIMKGVDVEVPQTVVDILKEAGLY